MKISAIICTYNREKYLPLLFESIEKQSLSEKDFEVVIINNNSTDNTEVICYGFIEKNPDMVIKYIVEDKQGLSYARNRGIAESTGGILTFLDDDAFLSDSFMETVLRNFEKNPDVYCIGGKIHLHYEDKPPVWVSKYMAEMFGFYDPGSKPFVYRNRKFPRGSNMSFRKSVFDKVGLFNTKLGRTGENMLAAEEKELFFRIYRMGLKSVYLPQALVYHRVPASRLELPQVIRQIEGIGCSEAILASQSKLPGLLVLVSRELFKWLASFVLMIIYSLQGRFQKGFFLLRFRYHIMKGIKKCYKI